MSELPQARNHARAMEVAEHRPDCVLEKPTGASVFGHKVIRRIHPHPDCTGCVDVGDRHLWRRIADELDDRLGQDTSWRPRTTDTGAAS